jgi:glycosyltransferase involved in cell wall biosynthesis
MDQQKLVKNILFLISGLKVGGTEKLLVDLVNHFDVSRFKITIVSLGDDNPMKEFIRAGHGDTIELPRKGKFDFSSIKQLAGIIREKQIEGVLCFSPFVYLFVKFALRRLRNVSVPVYVAFHNTKARNLKEYIQIFLYCHLFEKNVRLISICENQAEHYQKAYWLPQKLFRTIYNGIDGDYFTLPPEQFDKNAFLSTFGIPANARIILQVAGFRKEKKHDDAMRALHFLHLNTSLKPFLLFVGDGRDDIKKDLRKRISKFGLSEYVKFCGRHADVRPFYWSADLFTLSSVAVETFSISALEAMGCGVPCVLTDIGGADEMIIESINGKIVSPGSPKALAKAWEEILDSQNKFSLDKIRSTVETKFSLERCVEQYEEIFCQTQWEVR